MNRNFDLELRVSSPPSESSNSNMLDVGGNEKNSNEKKMTIFRNGRVVVCDVTELQARAILLLASRETAKRLDMESGLDPSLLPFLRSPLNTLSMKQSLQRFLQKRKTRIQEKSPCNRSL